LLEAGRAELSELRMTFNLAELPDVPVTAIDTSVPVATLIVVWYTLKKMGIPAQELCVILKAVGHDLISKVSEMEKDQDPTGQPVILQLIDNTLVGLSGYSSFYNYKTMEWTDKKLDSPIIAVGIAIGGLLHRYVYPNRID
jgi:hypothetical protein